ncbi:MAG: hypothetical protein ABI912_07720 [Actinomycetota bacterium]
MPKGIYHHLDDHSGELVAVEAFSCAPGPQGWRYVADVTDPDGAALGRVDVTVDAQWRPVRVEVRSGGWLVKAGAAGGEVLYVRLPFGEIAPGDEQSVTAAAVTGRSPAFAVATSRLLALAPPQDKKRIKLLAVTEPSAGVRLVDEGWALVDVSDHETQTGPLVVRRYEVADLATGDRGAWSIAGDVVVEGPHLELVELESPPNQ